MLLVKSKESKSSDKYLVRLAVVGLAGWVLPVFGTTPSTGVSASSYVSVLVSLLILVGVIYMLGFVLKRMNVTHSGSEQLQVVASMIVGSRERIVIIQVGEEQHMIGVTPQNINHLAKLDSQLEPSPSGQDFRQKLALLMSGKKDDGNKAPKENVDD